MTVDIPVQCGKPFVAESDTSCPEWIHPLVFTARIQPDNACVDPRRQPGPSNADGIGPRTPAPIEPLRMTLERTCSEKAYCKDDGDKDEYRCDYPAHGNNEVDGNNTRHNAGVDEYCKCAQYGDPK